MAALTKSEFGFLKSHELARLATSTKQGRPHVVPVIYAMDGQDIVIAVDYGTKKLKNLRENKAVALVVDDFRPNRGVMVEGDAEVFERGKEYLRLLQALFDKFEYYRSNPWKEGESPILKIHATKAVMW